MIVIHDLNLQFGLQNLLRIVFSLMGTIESLKKIFFSKKEVEKSVVFAINTGEKVGMSVIFEKYSRLEKGCLNYKISTVKSKFYIAQ